MKEPEELLREKGLLMTDFISSSYYFAVCGLIKELSIEKIKAYQSGYDKGFDAGLTENR